MQIDKTRIDFNQISNYKMINENCFASNASREIMLHRFFKGRKLEFPFLIN